MPVLYVPEPTDLEKWLSMTSLPPPSAPFQYLQVDFTHMPPIGNLKYMLVIVDRFYKLAEAFPCSKKNANIVVTILA